MSLFGSKKCVICKRRYPRRSGRLAFQLPADVNSALHDPTQEKYVEILGSIGVSITVRDGKKGVFICHACARQRIWPIAKEDIDRVVMGLKARAEKEPNLRGTYEASANVEELGALGEMGLPDALWGLIEVYELCKTTKCEPISVDYYVDELTVQFIKEGILSASDIDEHKAAMISEILCAKFADASDYEWSSWLESVGTIAASGVSMSPEIRALVQALADMSGHDVLDRTLKWARGYAEERKELPRWLKNRKEDQAIARRVLRQFKSQ